jgi:hypothetical protein
MISLLRLNPLAQSCAMAESWRGSLRNPAAPDASRWDWYWLDGCFGPTKISLTDVDQLVYAVERNDAILWIEVKRPGQEPGQGQRLLLEAFSRKDRCVALILWGRHDAPETAQWIVDGKSCEIVAADREQVAEWVHKWFLRAERGKLK